MQQFLTLASWSFTTCLVFHKAFALIQTWHVTLYAVIMFFRRRRRVSLVDVVSGMRAENIWGWNPGRCKRFFCFENRPDPLWELASYSRGSEAKAPGCNVQYSASSSIDVKSEYNYVFIPPVYTVHAFMLWTGIFLLPPVSFVECNAVPGHTWMYAGICHMNDLRARV
jgi:hypothetical protein